MHCGRPAAQKLGTLSRFAGFWQSGFPHPAGPRLMKRVLFWERIMATRGQSVSIQLREGILNGTYAGGQRLNEADLATEFSVSRTPIRAALSALAADGVLEYTPNAGYAVKSFTAGDIAQLVFETPRRAGRACRASGR